MLTLYVLAPKEAFVLAKKSPSVGGEMNTYLQQASINFFPPAKHNTILEMYILKWLTTATVRTSTFFRLRRVKSITHFHEMYFNWNDLPRPLLEPQNFFRLQRAEKLPRFQEIYVNWNGYRGLFKEHFS